MKKSIILFSLVSVCLGQVLADHSPEVQARINARRAEMLAERGGMVSKKQEGNFVKIANEQDLVPFDTIKSIISNLNVGTSLPIQFIENKSTGNIFDDVDNVFKTPKTGAALLIVAKKSFPSILSAPENAWAVLNMDSILDDMPPDEVAEKRIRTEVARAFATVFNAGNSMSRPCVMVPIYSKVDLDALKVWQFNPEVSSKIAKAAGACDVNPIRRTTYLRACEEGWAPAPTNDVQKAIWNKVHALPTNPIKIKFDPKKGE